MKKIAFILCTLIFASSCASRKCYGVGDTPHSRKSQKASQQKTYSQFPF